MSGRRRKQRTGLWARSSLGRMWGRARETSLERAERGWGSWGTGRGKRGRKWRTGSWARSSSASAGTVTLSGNTSGKGERRRRKYLGIRKQNLNKCYNCRALSLIIYAMQLWMNDEEEYLLQFVILHTSKDSFYWWSCQSWILYQYYYYSPHLMSQHSHSSWRPTLTWSLSPAPSHGEIILEKRSF